MPCLVNMRNGNQDAMPEHSLQGWFRMGAYHHCRWQSRQRSLIPVLSLIADQGFCEWKVTRSIEAVRSDVVTFGITSYIATSHTRVSAMPVRQPIETVLVQDADYDDDYANTATGNYDLPSTRRCYALQVRPFSNIHPRVDPSKRHTRPASAITAEPPPSLPLRAQAHAQFTLIRFSWCAPNPIWPGTCPCPCPCACAWTYISSRRLRSSS